MAVSIAPRLDPRLLYYIADAAPRASAAEVTRGAGELAWRLGLRRPSYQQVRVLRGLALQPMRPKGTRTIDARVIFQKLDQGFYWLCGYPGFGMSYGYRQKYHRRT